MFQALLTMIAVGLPLTFAGCDGQQHKSENAREVPLTAQDAKRALLEMDRKQIPSGILVPYPRDEPIETMNGDEISIGIYHCNLKEKTFHASAFYPNAIRHKLNDVSGAFERTADGKWIAKITHGSSGG